MFFNVVCVSLKVKVFHTIDARCNDKEYLHVMHKILFISELSQMRTQCQTWRLTLIELVTEVIKILQK
jgi:hypothetical protein